MAVHLQNLFGWIDAGLLAVGLAIAGYLVIQLRAFLATHAAFLDAQTRAQIVVLADQSLKDGVNWALKLLEREQAKHETVTFPGGVKGWIGAKAAQYAADHAGPELDSLGWSGDLLAQKIVAKLPPAWTIEDLTPNASSALKNQPVTVEPLPPVGSGACG